MRELIRAVVKAVLLYSEPLQELPTFGSTWRAILDCLATAMACGAAKSELLAEAIPEALKNMLLVLKTVRDGDPEHLLELGPGGACRWYSEAAGARKG